MNGIVLRKLEIPEIEVLQTELFNFLSYKNASLPHLNKRENEFFDTLLMIDISQKMYYSFRGKIEKTKALEANINLSCSEAVILLSCCNFSKTVRNDFQKFVMHKVSTLLHQQLINF